MGTYQKINEETKKEEISEKEILNIARQFQLSDNEYNIIKNKNLFLKCICKIHLDKSLGTGFFYYIPSINMKVIITNNHILSKEFLDNSNELVIKDYKNERKIINIALDRFKYSDEEIDFSIIEILKEDNISNYFEIDKDFKDSKKYMNKKFLC